MTASIVRRGSPWLLAAIAGAACSRAAPPAPSAEPIALSAAPLAAAPPVSPASPTLVLADDQGIREVGYDGATLRTLSRTPARRPRFFPGRAELVFYVPSAGEIRRLSLASGAETRVATLPRAFKTCGKLPDYPLGHVFAPADLDVQTDGRFVLDAQANAVCLTLQDRNDNMVNVMIAARIDLASGHVSHEVTLGGDCSTPPPTRGVRASPAVPPCAAEGSAPLRSATPFAVASLGVGADVVEEGVAPSGRWSLLGQPRGEGDYLYRAVFLLDRQRRLVYPIVAGPFPPPLTAGQLAHLADFAAQDGDLPDGGTTLAYGESAVHWLDRDAILVGSRLVVPGQGGVSVSGDVAL
jgi:hypothetical protein